MYNAGELDYIAKQLKEKFGDQFLSIKYFHGWVVLRSWGDWPWDACPTIEYTLSAYGDGNGDVRAAVTLIYQNEGTTFEDCEIFKFIFFE